jgi:hypothetical protein
MVKVIKIIMYIFALFTIGLSSAIIAFILWDKKYLKIGDMIDETFNRRYGYK